MCYQGVATIERTDLGFLVLGKTPLPRLLSLGHGEDSTDAVIDLDKCRQKVTSSHLLHMRELRRLLGADEEHEGSIELASSISAPIKAHQAKQPPSLVPAWNDNSRCVHADELRVLVGADLLLARIRTKMKPACHSRCQHAAADGDTGVDTGVDKDMGELNDRVDGRRSL